MTDTAATTPAIRRDLDTTPMILRSLPTEPAARRKRNANSDGMRPWAVVLFVLWLSVSDTADAGTTWSVTSEQSNEAVSDTERRINPLGHLTPPR